MAKRTKKIRQARRGKAAAPKPMGAPVAHAPAPPTPNAAGLAALNDVDEAFFRRGEELAANPPNTSEDSIPPTTDDVEKESLPPSPEVLERRSRFRKFVAAVVVLCVFVVLGGLGKTIVTEKSASAAQVGRAQSSSPVEAAHVGVVRPPRIDEQPKLATKPPAPASAEASPEPAETVDAAPDVDDPRKEALNLLNRGKMAEAIPMARAAIQRDPNHALGYLYLGTALQESGKHKEAIAAYGDCVRNAKQGPIWECRAMGGRE